MSRLETQIQPMLSGVIRDGESMCFPRRDRSKLAAFAFKNAVIANYLNPTREPFFTRAARERFRKSRQIPPGVSMWFASLSTIIPSGLYFGYVLGVQQKATDNRLRDDIEMYVHTFAVGHLVLQLLAFRYAHIANRSFPLPELISAGPEFENHSVCFWPNAGETVRWPPASDLTEQLLSKFTHRWNATIELV
jgi:hypothetical protein